MKARNGLADAAKGQGGQSRQLPEAGTPLNQATCQMDEQRWPTNKGRSQKCSVLLRRGALGELPGASAGRCSLTSYSILRHVPQRGRVHAWKSPTRWRCS